MDAYASGGIIPIGSNGHYQMYDVHFEDDGSISISDIPSTMTAEQRRDRDEYYNSIYGGGFDSPSDSWVGASPVEDECEMRPEPPPEPTTPAAPRRRKITV